MNLRRQRGRRRAATLLFQLCGLAVALRAPVDAQEAGEQEDGPSDASVAIGIILLILVGLLAIASTLIAQYNFSKQRVRGRQFMLSAKIMSPPTGADGGALTSSIAEIDFGTNTIGFGRRTSHFGVQMDRPEKARSERTGSDGSWHSNRRWSELSPATTRSPVIEDEVLAVPSDASARQSVV